MKRIFSIVVFTVLSGSIYAQAPGAPQRAARQPVAPAPPIPLRQVSGVVKDSTDQAVIGAIVTLTSRADTMKASTNPDGVFVFKNVKSWEFTISISSLGYRTKVIPGKYNDATARLTMDPVILRSAATNLDEVKINGTPSIVYKTDTVQFQASDYVVRAGATVDELLKKMEGMEVSSDGTLTYNNVAIGKARLNGKDLYGGDVASVIQSLPADIIDKAQVVDDYGDQAKRTGIKDGDPTKVLNLTTRVDKSVGNLAQLNGGGGTTSRMEGNANLTRVNGNKTIGLIGTFSRIPNGVAGGNVGVGQLGVNRGGQGGGGGGFGGGGGGGGGGGAASGGRTFSVSPRASYRDNLGKNTEMTLNYSFNYSNPDQLTNSYSEAYTNGLAALTTTRANETNNYNKTHNFNGEFEMTLDSANYLQIRPTFSYTGADNNSLGTTLQTGLNNQNQVNRSDVNSTAPSYGGTVGYQHVWLKKPMRTFSFEGTVTRNHSDNDNLTNNLIKYFDPAVPTYEKDSIVNRLITTNNFQNSYRGSLTYAEPLGKVTRLEFNSNVERRDYDNTKLSNNLATGTAVLINAESNIFNYNFTQYRNSLNFRYGNNATKANLSLGATFLNTQLAGSKASLGTNVNQNYFKLIPIARFQYRFSRTHSIAINYQGSAAEPSFDQIQPVKDVSDIIHNNIVFGNPDLKVQFTHRIIATYNNYIPNTQLNYSFTMNSSFVDNKVAQNNIKILDPSISKNYLNEQHYLNLDGERSYGGTYQVSKPFAARKYRLELSGSVDNSRQVNLNQSNLNYASSWHTVERFGPRINPTTSIEINPYVSYDINKIDYSLPNLLGSKISTLSYSLDGNVYFLKNMQFGYALSKSMQKGISSNIGNNSPFIANASLQTRVFKNKAGLQIRAFDIFNENHLASRTLSANGGFTDTQVNPVSRYFMVNLSMRLQKWSGAQGRNGRPIQRRGDGSFVN